MTLQAKIGIIGGNGWLGSAITRAVIGRGVVDAKNLMISSRGVKGGIAAELDTPWTQNPVELVQWADVVILSIPPDQFKGLGLNMAEKLVVSVMAGVSSAALAAGTGASRIVRTMPNAAAEIGKSFTPWFASSACTSGDKALVQAFFDGCGEAAEVTQDAHIDFCCGLTGAGAAFPALLAEALIARATAQGMSLDFAKRAAKGVVCNASQLFRASQADTAAIVQGMIDYKGTTAAALLAMKTAGFETSVGAGLAAAAAKVATIAKD